MIMSDHYLEQREADHFVNKTSTPKSEKDSWQTPKVIFDALHEEFNFSADVCASRENTLCDKFFTKEDNALHKKWGTLGNAVFCNPPYSLINDFINEAIEQAQTFGVTIVMLVNANTDVNWFANAVATANEVRLITGRISFVKPDGTTGKGQNSKGQALIVWRGNCQTPCQITMVDRKTLEQK